MGNWYVWWLWLLSSSQSRDLCIISLDFGLQCPEVSQGHVLGSLEVVCLDCCLWRARTRRAKCTSSECPKCKPMCIFDCVAMHTYVRVQGTLVSICCAHYVAISGLHMYVCALACVCDYKCMHAMACLWLSENNLAVSSHFPPCLKYSLLLFEAVYTRQAGPHVSRDSHVSVSHLVSGTGVTDPCVSGHQTAKTVMTVMTFVNSTVTIVLSPHLSWCYLFYIWKQFILRCIYLI